MINNTVGCGCGVKCVFLSVYACLVLCCFVDMNKISRMVFKKGETINVTGNYLKYVSNQ